MVGDGAALEGHRPCRGSTSCETASGRRYRDGDAFELALRSRAKERGGEALARDDPIEGGRPRSSGILSETYPDAKVALDFSNALEMLVATILSAQCTDEKVNEVTATLFQKYRTPEDYLRVPEDELKARHQADGLLQPEGDLDPRGVPPDRRGVRGRGPGHDGGPRSRSAASRARPRTSCSGTRTARSRGSRSTPT